MIYYGDGQLTGTVTIKFTLTPNKHGITDDIDLENYLYDHIDIDHGLMEFDEIDARYEPSLREVESERKI